VLNPRRGGGTEPTKSRLKRLIGRGRSWEVDRWTWSFAASWRSLAARLLGSAWRLRIESPREGAEVVINGRTEERVGEAHRAD